MIREIFGRLVKGAKLRRPDDGPGLYGRRGLDEKGALFMARATAAAKWADVEFYGPGAAEAEARRSPKVTTAEAPPAVALKKRRRLSKRERLERKAAKLRAEIEALK